MTRWNKIQLAHFCLIRGKKKFLTSPLKMMRVVQKFRFHRAVLHRHSHISVVVLLSRTAARGLVSHKTCSNCKFDKMSHPCDVKCRDSLRCTTNSTCSKEERSSEKLQRPQYRVGMANATSQVPSEAVGLKCASDMRAAKMRFSFKLSISLAWNKHHNISGMLFQQSTST